MVMATESGHMCKPSYTPDDAAVATGIDVSHIRKAIRSGELEARLIGNQLVVTTRALNRWLRKQPLLVLAGVGEGNGGLENLSHKIDLQETTDVIE